MPKNSAVSSDMMPKDLQDWESVVTLLMVWTVALYLGDALVSFRLTIDSPAFVQLAIYVIGYLNGEIPWFSS